MSPDQCDFLTFLVILIFNHLHQGNNNYQIIYNYCMYVILYDVVSNYMQLI